MANPKGRPTKGDLYERAFLFSKAMTPREVSVALGMGVSTVYAVRSAAKAAENGDLAALANYYKRSSATAEWACNRSGIPIREVIAIAEKPKPKPEVTDRTPTDNRPDTDRSPTGREQLLPIASNCSEDNTAQAMVNILTKLDSIASALSRVCGAIINLQNCMVEQQKIITHTIDVNCDIVAQEVIRNKDILDGIKCNTRPRKGQ